MKDLDINQVPSGAAEEEWISAGMEDEEESTDGAPPRKKLRLSKEQSRLLEESFRHHHSLNPVTKPPPFSLSIYCKTIIFCDLFKINLWSLTIFMYAETERSISFAVEAEA